MSPRRSDAERDPYTIYQRFLTCGRCGRESVSFGPLTVGWCGHCKYFAALHIESMQVLRRDRRTGPKPESG